jgi:hypothetical protein
MQIEKKKVKLKPADASSWPPADKTAVRSLCRCFVPQSSHPEFQTKLK